MDELQHYWGWFVGSAHGLTTTKGLKETDKRFLECMGLVVSEVGGAVQAFRSPRTCSPKILAYSHAAEKLADIVIGLADMCCHFDIEAFEIHALGNFYEPFEEIDPLMTDKDAFSSCFRILCAYSDCFDPSPPCNPIEGLAMVSAYLGDAIFAHLHGKDPDVSLAIADAILAVCRVARTERINLGEAILAKHAYNSVCSYRHDAKLF